MANDKAKRDAKGRFGKGNIANPGGRKELPKELKEMCRERTAKAIEIAVKIMEDEKQPAMTRLKAIEIILERGYGRPQQSIDVDATTEIKLLID